MSDVVPGIQVPNGPFISPSQVQQIMWGGRESGIAWALAAPDLITRICQKHNIVFGSEQPELSMNLVLFGDSATLGPVVLKLNQPHNDLANEIAVMHQMSGKGYPTFFDANETEGWLLQERMEPGKTLQGYVQRGEIDDAVATELAATLIRSSSATIPTDHEFPDLKRWLKSLCDYADLHPTGGVLPREQIDLAMRHANWLIEHPETPRLLHGDFHHGNIIDSANGWTRIDPKGLVAEQSFEIGPWFYNPIGVDKRTDLPELFTARLDVFERVLGIDRVRLWRSASVACVLSDCWTLEDGPAYHTHFDSITAALMQLPESML